MPKLPCRTGEGRRVAFCRVATERTGRSGNQEAYRRSDGCIRDASGVDRRDRQHPAHQRLQTPFPVLVALHGLRTERKPAGTQPDFGGLQGGHVPQNAVGADGCFAGGGEKSIICYFWLDPKVTKRSRLRLLRYSLPALRCSHRKLALCAQTAMLPDAPFRSFA